MIRALALSCCLPLCASCGDDDETASGSEALRGSVDAIYDLEFQTVRARLTSRELAIEYVAADGQLPVQVIVRVADAMVEGPGSFDIETVGDIVGERDNASLPALKDGTLTLGAYKPEDGASVEGSFDAVVETQRAQYSLTGTFETELEDMR